MQKFLAHARDRPYLAAAFAAAMAAMVFFAVRVVVFSVHWSDPQHRDQRIEGWMTPGYVAHSWHVPRVLVLETLEITPQTDGRRQTLADLARARGVETLTLIAVLDAAIAAHRAAPE